MSLMIGGMPYPLMNQSPTSTSQSQRVSAFQTQMNQQDNIQTAAQRTNLSSMNSTESQLKKYSECISNYSKAEISIQSGSNSGMIGTETTGTAG